ncbi:MAG: hypothetical protein LM601_09105 [Candidatus Verstraetearchaeota archaeon]|jgi:hypothetical protein|nr:hypothetical protein [Candidatus Verstraetearchaeota archaeon]
MHCCSLAVFQLVFILLDFAIKNCEEFRKLGPKDFIRFMRNPAVVDGRRIYDPEVYSRKLKFEAMGFNCWKIS